MSDAKMLPDGSVELPWPDQVRTYRLRLGELRELQEKCNKGPMELRNDLLSGRWRVDDIFQTIRLGCIGAKMNSTEALLFAERHCGPGKLSEAIAPALMIISAAMTGPPDDEIEPPKGAPGKTLPATAGSSSRSSTDRGRRSSAGRHGKSTK
jgi:hypothetical protein